MLSNKRILHGFLSGGMACAGSAFGFFIVFLVKGFQGKPVVEWYIPTVIFTVVATILIATWYSGRDNPEHAKKTMIVTSIAGSFSAALFITWGVIFLY